MHAATTTAAATAQKRRTTQNRYISICSSVAEAYKCVYAYGLNYEMVSRCYAIF